MKVLVDMELCDGHGTCIDACPEVFDMGDDDDVVTVLDDSPDDSLRPKLERAVAVCPKAAISLPDGD
jgi:ferredoxin